MEPTEQRAVGMGAVEAGTQQPELLSSVHWPLASHNQKSEGDELASTLARLAGWKSVQNESKGADREYLMDELSSHFYTRCMPQKASFCQVSHLVSHDFCRQYSIQDTVFCQPVTQRTEHVGLRMSQCPFPLEDIPGRLWQALFIIFLTVEIVVNFSFQRVLDSLYIYFFLPTLLVIVSRSP